MKKILLLEQKDDIDTMFEASGKLTQLLNKVENAENWFGLDKQFIQQPYSMMMEQTIELLQYFSKLCSNSPQQEKSFHEKEPEGELGLEQQDADMKMLFQRPEL